MAKRFLLVIVTVGVVFMTASGCSRSMINYQIAESIGTLGEYENNEPVETPKMQAEREQQESEERLEEQRQQVLSEAERLSVSYCYEDAIALLENSDLLEGDDRAELAIREYRAAKDALREYNGSVVHLNFPNLIVDTDLAIDGDNSAQTYEQNLITINEFSQILNQLYQNGYILIDIHDLADETEDEFGDVQLSRASLMLPAGKKPLVLSVENLNYASVLPGDGVATRLVLDEDGEVAAVYTDSDGISRMGAYDVVPVLEQFIAEHPDFSYQGARGIIGLSGENGIFGYEIAGQETDDGEEDKDQSEILENNRQAARSVAERLLESGWTFASEGYSYTYMNSLSYDSLVEDLTKWQNTVGKIVGDCDTLIYPYGSEVDKDSDAFVWLLDEGYHYLVGLWASEDYFEINPTYLRQTRRAVTGYILDHYSSYFASIFNISEILDGTRQMSSGTN